MRIYLSGFSTRELEEYVRCIPQAKLNILLSYGLKTGDYRNFLDKNHKNIDSLILDSGAFTANFTKNKENLKFTFEGYKSFCLKYKDRYDFAFNYDIDFDKNNFSTNYMYLKRLREEGINVVPVIHDYTEEESDIYIKDNYEIIAIGYSDTEKNEENIRLVSNKLYSNGRKVHALGVSSYSWLANSPIHFADSSSWAKYPAYGFMPFWNLSLPDDDKTHKLKFEDYTNSKLTKYQYNKYQYKHDLEKYLKERFGYEYIDLYSSKTIKRKIVSIDYYIKLQEAVTAKHKSLGFNTDWISKSLPLRKS